MAQVENDISRNIIQISNTKTRIERLHKTLKELDEEIAAQNEIISK